MAKVDWDQGAYETNKGFEVLPKGRYLCLITDSDDKKTKAQDGRYFEFEFTVLKPEQFKGRKLWARFNVHNPSETAQRIGREQFNSLAEACDALGKVQKTEQLHDKTVVVLAAVTKDQKDRDTNEVVGFQKHEGPKPSATAASKPDPAPAPKKPAFDAADDDIPF